MLKEAAFNAAPEIRRMNNMTGWLSTLCAIPALTIMLYSRKRLGFNSTSLFTIFVLWLALSALGFQGLLLSAVFGIAMHRDLEFSSILSHIDPWLLLFAQSVLVIGVVTHIRRLREFKRGVLWYSHSGGIPRISAALPLLRPWIVRRIIEPAFIFFLGFGVMFFSVMLGLWLCWAAICLAIYEQLEADERFHTAVDIGDMIIMSNCEIAAGFEEGETPTVRDMYLSLERQGAEQQREISKMFGVTADEDADELRANLERRRRRQKQTHAIDYGAGAPRLGKNEPPAAGTEGATV